MSLKTRRPSLVSKPVDDRLAYIRHNSGILENDDLRWQRNESVERLMGFGHHYGFPYECKNPNLELQQ